MKFHPHMTETQIAKNEAGDVIGWIGKIGDGYTWVVPNGLMSLSPTGDGNFPTREAAHRMLTGMYERPEVYGFKREDWSTTCP